jgi:hypothetical protein
MGYLDNNEFFYSPKRVKRPKIQVRSKPRPPTPPDHDYQLFSEDLKTLPIGISLRIMTQIDGLKPKLGADFVFTGVDVDGGMLKFKSHEDYSPPPLGYYAYAYGCECTPGKDWQRHVWIVFNDKDLMENYDYHKKANK